MLGLIFSTTGSTLRLESESAMIAFGDNKECVIQLEDGVLKSSCEITEPPSYTASLLADQNILRTTHVAGSLSDYLKFNEDQTADWEHVVAFGVPVEKYEELAQLSDMNSEWTIQVDLKGALTGSNAYCHVYHNVDTVALNWGDGTTTGEHGDRILRFWREAINLNSNENSYWKILKCGEDTISGNEECKLVDKGLGISGYTNSDYDNVAKMLSLRTQRRSDEKLEFTLLGATSASDSEGTQVLFKAETKNTYTFNNCAKCVPISVYCQYLQGRVYSWRRVV
jgi:hypothetical protein